MKKHIILTLLLSLAPFLNIVSKEKKEISPTKKQAQKAQESTEKTVAKKIKSITKAQKKATQKTKTATKTQKEATTKKIDKKTISKTKNKKKKKKETKSFDDVIFDWSGTFAEVLQIVGEKHYKVAKPKNCMIKAINSFLNCLDPHSSFLDPKTYKAILETTSGQFYGIGIVIGNTRSPKEKFLGVINTIPGGPADKAGVKAEDKIIEIDGKKLEGMTTEEATAKLRGERNTKVGIKVIREKIKEPLGFEITRDVIKEQSSLAFYIKNHNIFYVSLTTFSKNSAKQIREILKRSTKKQYKGIILDLRNNSGGLLRSVINIAGIFLDKGSLVATTKNKHDKVIAAYKTTQKPVANVKIPIFVLVNNYTASASEILAGCLKMHSQELSEQSKKKPQKRLMVFIVGTNTFGKGSVQEVIPIGNCAIKLTTSLYFLPNDKTIQGTGITPDFIIPKLFPPPQKVVWFMKNYGREKSLKHSIKPNGAKEDKKDKKSEKKPKTWAERIKKALSTDNQFFETIQLINALYVAKKKCRRKISTRQKAIEYLQSIFALDGKIELEQVKI